MGGPVDPVGRVLLRAGSVTEQMVSDVLELQKRRVPFASMCYLLGYADEEVLARALSKQRGIPAVLLDHTVVCLDVLIGVSRDIAVRNNLLPLFEDERRIFVAAEDPSVVHDALGEVLFVRNKTVVPHLALQATLARTIRACYTAIARGERYCAGPAVDPTRSFPAEGNMPVVSDVDVVPVDPPIARAHDAVHEDVTKELTDVVLLSIESEDTVVLGEVDTLEEPPSDYRVVVLTPDGTMPTPLSSVAFFPSKAREEIDLDDSYVAEEDGSRRVRRSTGDECGPRVLIVDDDLATRHFLTKQLRPHGHIADTAATGGEAVRMIKANPPSLVVIDVMLPEIDGFQICRAIKRSRKYNYIPVILMSAVIDSGRVTDEVLKQYGADAYFEKPLNGPKITECVRALLRSRSHTAPPDTDETFRAALQFYRDGEIDSAVDRLREGLAVDPLSAKHRFVLANLLQKKALLYEAIEEYEVTVDLKPDYFPALTRLAYLYYRKGFSAKAIETWRRSLPLCPDADLRQNIEVFMRKLIADMQPL